MFSFRTGLVLLILLILLYIFLYFKDFNLIFVKSKKDDNYHLVRNLPDKNLAADRMATIKKRLTNLVAYLSEKYPKDPRVERLEKKFNTNSIQETRLDSPNTSFSVDKGQEIHLCLRDKTDDFNLHDINTLMFVALHELAHVASKNKGHEDEFQKNFVWILQNAIKIGIYVNVDYATKNQNFCGDVINSNPLISSMRILKN